MSFSASSTLVVIFYSVFITSTDLKVKSRCIAARGDARIKVHMHAWPTHTHGPASKCLLS